MLALFKTLIGSGMDNNRRIDAISKRNIETEKAIKHYRAGLISGNSKRADFPRLKQIYPYFGMVPCSASGIEFVMFHAHDDIVAWEYLWFGSDGYEKEIVKKWVEWCKDPGVYLDIGAYSGLMSILAAKAHPENEVHLFEPIDRTIERANINVKINGLSQRIQRHAIAASDASGRAKINLYRDENFLGTGNSIYNKENKKTYGYKTIRTASVDEFLPDILPKAIKIDVEGHELPCLIGLKETIQRAKPKMIVEVWEHARPKVLALLNTYGYDCVRIENVEKPVNNYFALPR